MLPPFFAHFLFYSFPKPCIPMPYYSIKIPKLPRLSSLFSPVYPNNGQHASQAALMSTMGLPPHDLIIAKATAPPSAFMKLLLYLFSIRRAICMIPQSPLPTQPGTSADSPQSEIQRSRRAAPSAYSEIPWTAHLPLPSLPHMPE